MKRFFVAIGLIQGLLLGVHAQTIAEELTRINAFYADVNTAYDFNYSYQLYLEEKASEPTEEKYVVMQMKGDEQKVTYDGVTLITTPQYTLMVDHPAKEVILSQGPILGHEDKLSTLTSKIESLLQHCEDTTLSGGRKKNVITLQCPSTHFDQITIEYSSKDYHINRMTLYMRKNHLMEEGVRPRIVINYTKVAKNAPIQDEVFTYNDYLLEREDGVLELNSDYKDYTFSNYLQ